MPSQALPIPRRSLTLSARTPPGQYQVSHRFVPPGLDLALVATPQGDAAMRRLREAVEGLDVGVLVNNAGVAKPCAVYLHEADVDAWVRMIRVNLWALTEVTAAVLPGMVDRKSVV